MKDVWGYNNHKDIIREYLSQNNHIEEKNNSTEVLDNQEEKEQKKKRTIDPDTVKSYTRECRHRGKTRPTIELELSVYGTVSSLLT